MKYLTIAECRNGYLYIIKARHARIGIFEEETGSFITRRVKGNDIYLSKELHWDIDENFGTTKPIEEIEKTSKFKDDTELLDYLKTKAEEQDQHIEDVLLLFFYSEVRGGQ